MDPLDMRRLLLLVFLVGCGEQGYANVSTADAGDDTGSQGGTAGTDATTPPVDAGTDVVVVKSCNIPVEQVTGTDTSSVYNRGLCMKGSMTQTTEILNGEVAGSPTWMRTSYLPRPHGGGSAGGDTTNGLCDITLQYGRVTVGCKEGELLYVWLTLPGI